MAQWIESRAGGYVFFSHMSSNPRKVKSYEKVREKPRNISHECGCRQDGTSSEAKCDRMYLPRWNFSKIYHSFLLLLALGQLQIVLFDFKFKL